MNSTSENTPAPASAEKRRSGDHMVRVSVETYAELRCVRAMLCTLANGSRSIPNRWLANEPSFSDVIAFLSGFYRLAHSQVSDLPQQKEVLS